MQDVVTFNEILKNSARAWSERDSDEFLLSVAMPIKEVDPLFHLPLLVNKEQFSFLWDCFPEFCLAAAGQCQYLDLAGSQRFDVAQRFCDETFNQLVNISPETPRHALPRILLTFSFFDHISKRTRELEDRPPVQAVLPRWQLSFKTGFSWLRLNCVVSHESDAREASEHLWIMNEKLSRGLECKSSIFNGQGLISSVSQDWKDCYRSALLRGLDLVNSESLDKLVLAVRKSIYLQEPLDPLTTLSRLRNQKGGSCRFLWRTNPEESFFGASPERLISISNGQLRSDALAGTASREDDGDSLLKSEKNLREHEFVVVSIMRKLFDLGLRPRRASHPQLARQGHLLHLHTPIFASSTGQQPLYLVGALHPTPAVAGLPQREALSWLRTLEPFDRGNYAAPIGWIDINGDAEFRVAIRSGYSRGKNLELIAGAGLVKGSSVEGELQEVGLKFEVIADQLNLDQYSQSNSFRRRSIT